MANANITSIQVTNTFDEWRVATNNLISDRNILRNAPYVKDNSNFTVANGAVTISRSGGGVLLTVTGTGGASVGGLTETTDLRVNDEANIFMANIATTMEVTGNTRLYSNLAVSRNVTVSQNANVTGTLNVGSNTAITGNAFMLSSANIAGVLHVNNESFITGNTYLQSNAIVSSNASISQNLEVIGNANVLTDLGVTGVSTLTGNVIAVSNASIGQNLTVTGNAQVLSNLSVTQRTTTANLTVSSIANVVTANIITANVATLNVNASGSQANILSANIITANIATLNVSATGAQANILTANVTNLVSPNAILSIANVTTRANATLANIVALYANTIDVRTLTVQDPILAPAVTADSGYVLRFGASTDGDGFLRVRRVSGNAELYWDETTDKWRFLVGGSPADLVINTINATTTNTTTAITTTLRTTTANVTTANLGAVSISGYGQVIAANGVWVGQQTNLIGPQGPQGPQGLQGPAGPQGPQGPQGPGANQALNTTSDVLFNSIQATNNITAYVSDERLKTILGKIENALDKVNSLDGFYFELNDLGKSLGLTGKRDVGVSAQRLNAIMPEVIAPAPVNNNYMTVRYEKIIPLLIEAIKELDKKIDALSNKGE